MAISRRGLFWLAACAAVSGPQVIAAVKDEAPKSAMALRARYREAQHYLDLGKSRLLDDIKRGRNYRMAAVQWTPQEIEILRKRGQDSVTAKMEQE